MISKKTMRRLCRGIVDKFDMTDLFATTYDFKVLEFILENPDLESQVMDNPNLAFTQITLSKSKHFNISTDISDVVDDEWMIFNQIIVPAVSMLIEKIREYYPPSYRFERLEKTELSHVIGKSIPMRIGQRYVQDSDTGKIRLVLSIDCKMEVV